MSIDELQTVHIWNSYTESLVVEGRHNFDGTIYTSLEKVLKTRDFHFSQQIYLFKILQEIIRIDADADHIYHSAAKDYLDELLRLYVFIDGLFPIKNRHNIITFIVRVPYAVCRGLVEAILKTLDTLYSWQWTSPPVRTHLHVFFSTIYSGLSWVVLYTNVSIPTE